jgi:hypothetical protein
MSAGEEYGDEMRARDLAATTAHGMATLLEAIAALSVAQKRIEALVEQIALGLGIDINKY